MWAWSDGQKALKPQRAVMSLQDNAFSYVFRLPFEIRDAIFDILSKDRQALVACGMTCRTWYSATRPYLFHTVRLLGSYQYAGFEALLHTSPHLAPYVRDLSIVLDGTFSWMDQEAPRILLQLPKVEALYIRNWSATIMSDETRRSLRRLFPSVKTLVLQDVAFAGNDLPLLLCACPRLSVLHLRDVDWSHRNRPLVAARAVGRCRIDELTVRSTSSLAAAWLVEGPFDLPLHKLDFVWEQPVQLRPLRAILQGSAATLQHLILFFKLEYGLPVPPEQELCLDLSPHASLTTLHLTHNLFKARADNEKHFHLWVSHALSSVRSPHLRHIELVLHFDDVDTIGLLDWGTIDETLTGMAAAQPRLVVTVYLHYNSSFQSPSTKDVVSAVVNRLPRFTVETHRLGIVCTNTCDVEMLSSLPFGGPVAEEDA